MRLRQRARIGILALVIFGSGTSPLVGAGIASATPGVGSPAGASCDIDDNGLVSKDTVAATCALLQRLLPMIGSALRVPTLQLDDQVHVIFSKTPGSTANTAMFTSFFGREPNAEPCQTAIYPITWKGERGPVLSPVFKVELAHEMVHCYQHAIVGYQDSFQKNVGGQLSLPGWIADGTATYMATRLLGYGEPGTPFFWKDGWIGAPNNELVGRTYDGVGWFWLVSKITGDDLYARFPALWKDASTAGDGGVHALKAMGGDAAAVMQAWGPSLLNQPSWGDAWTTPGIGVPATADPAESKNTIAAENIPYHLNVAPLAATVDTESLVSDGIVEVSTSSGYFSVHDAAGQSYLALSDELFCLKDACGDKNVVCPGSTKPATLLPLMPPFVVAAAGSLSAAVVTMENIPPPKTAGATLELPPSAGPCDPMVVPRAPTAAYSEGDPHLQSLSGASYDFQGAGEYTLARSKSGDVDVQVRAEPFEGSRSVAFNTAVAMRVVSTDVEVDTGAPAILYLDKKLLRPPKSGLLALTGGGTLTNTTFGGADDIAVKWPDGTEVDIAASKLGEDVTLVPPTAGVDTFSGMLAAQVVTRESTTSNHSPPSQTLLGSDGHRYVIDPTTAAGFRTLYGPFATSWRVTKSTSLFRYGKGKSTSSFLVKGFPAALVTASHLSLPKRQRAEATCKAAGVSASQLLDDCVVDLAETGKAAFATTTSHIAGSAVSSTPTTTTSPPVASGHPASYYFTHPCTVITIGEVRLAVGPTDTLDVDGESSCAFRPDSSAEVDAITFSAQSAALFESTRPGNAGSGPVASLGHDAYCIVTPANVPDQSFVVASLGAAGSIQVLADNCTQGSALAKDALARISN